MARKPAKSDVMVVGGRHVLEAAALAGTLRRVHCEPGAEQWVRECGGDVPVQVGSPAALRDRFGPEWQQGVVSELQVPAPVSADALVHACLENGRPLLVLEDVQDPQNLGSMFRAAAALGAAGLVMSKNRSAPVTAAVLRASVGCALSVPHAQVGGIPNFLLQQCDALQKVATVADGGAPPSDVDLAQPTAIVLGSEGKGLKPLTVSRCDVHVTIPMVAAESLNVAQAAVVFLYEIARQRRPA